MLKLNNTIRVMIPTKDNDGKAINYMELIQGVTKLVGVYHVNANRKRKRAWMFANTCSQMLVVPTYMQ